MSGAPDSVGAMRACDEQPWFLETLREHEILDAAGMNQAFTAAFDHADGAMSERWRGWVRQAVQQALTRAKRNPGGLLLKVLRNGPSEDLGKAHATAPESPTERRAREAREYLAEQKRLAEQLPFYGQRTRPPLSYALRALREKRDPQEIYDAWEAAGFPPPHEFPYPDTNQPTSALRLVTTEEKNQ